MTPDGADRLRLAAGDFAARMLEGCCCGRIAESGRAVRVWVVDRRSAEVDASDSRAAWSDHHMPHLQAPLQDNDTEVLLVIFTAMCPSLGSLCDRIGDRSTSGSFPGRLSRSNIPPQEMSDVSSQSDRLDLAGRRCAAVGGVAACAADGCRLLAARVEEVDVVDNAVQESVELCGRNAPQARARRRTAAARARSRGTGSRSSGRCAGKSCDPQPGAVVDRGELITSRTDRPA